LKKGTRRGKKKKTIVKGKNLVPGGEDPRGLGINRRAKEKTPKRRNGEIEKRWEGGGPTEKRGNKPSFWGFSRKGLGRGGKKVGEAPPKGPRFQKKKKGRGESRD